MHPIDGFVLALHCWDDRLFATAE